MGKHRILIVDDSKEVRRLLRDSLETLGAGFDILDVPSGEEAMLVSSNQKFDLLVTDVRLPGISGLELKALAQINNPQIQMILITGMSEPDIRRQVAEAGAYAFFYKPIEIADFLDAVERCLGLVETLLPPQPIYDESAEGPSQTLAERLAAFRHETGALAAALLDERGRVVAMAGELPGISDEAALLAALMAALSASARVSYTMDAGPGENWLFFRGAGYQLFLTNVGAAQALLVLLPPEGDSQLLLGALNQEPSIVQDLLGILTKMGLPAETPGEAAPAPASPEPAPAPSEELETAPGLDLLFEQAQEKSLIPDNVDAFWDSLAEQDSAEEVINADALTYDQARKLGLAPEEEDL